MSSILRNSLAKFPEPNDENSTLSFCLNYAMEEAVQDCHCHPGVECIGNGQIEQLIQTPGHTQGEKDEV